MQASVLHHVVEISKFGTKEADGASFENYHRYIYIYINLIISYRKLFSIMDGIGHKLIECTSPCVQNLL